MAEITRKRSGELLRGVFRILTDHPEGLPAKEVLSLMESEVPPTEFESSDYPNSPGVRRYEKIIRFTTITSVKAGWLVKNRGQWSITDEGRRAYHAFPDPKEFILRSISLYKEWKQQQPEELSEEEAETLEIAATYEEAEELAWGQVQEYLAAMNPYDFQKVVAGLLRGMGYHVAWVAPPGADGGIDIVAHTDPLGVQGPRIKVQVKRQQSTISVSDTRSFMATLGESDTGLFISIGGFTAESQREARAQERRRLMLVDLRQLFDLWVQHYQKIPEEERSLLPLRPVCYLAPQER